VVVGAFFGLITTGREESLGVSGEEKMAKKACELCRCEVEPESIERHYIVPREITEQAGVRRSKIVRLCPDCREELQRWYAAKVADMTYDTEIKRFRGRSPLEMVKEYETAYQRFVRYKKGQQRIA